MGEGPGARFARLPALLGFRGRTGRLGFLGWYLLGATYALILLLAFAGLASKTGSVVLVLLAGVPVVWVGLVLTVRRLHDIGASGWHVLWLWGVPFAVAWADGIRENATQLITHGIFAGLCLIPGTAGPNRFGAPPGTAATAASPHPH